ncbi:MAG: anthranilate phosphoribosyltransferase [Elusimicrobiota bacterium]
MIKEAISKLIVRQNLTEAEALGCMREIMNGEATSAQIAAFLVALRMKGETAEEITGCARVMRQMATQIKILNKEAVVIDTCGTGGDCKGTFNISTTTAFVAAGAGLIVAKHGNRSVSSCSGSADLLEALGVNINLTPEQVENCINEIGIGFLFAPLLHKAMKHAIGPRKEIATRTIFNILGPLTNPAQADVQLLGVYDLSLVELLANVLKNLGTRHAFVVHGEDGLDEITTTGQTTMAEVFDGKLKLYQINPKDFGIPLAQLSDLKGGEAKENAEITLRLLKGEKGPKRDIVVLNAAAALIAAGKAKDFPEGLVLAGKSIDSGAALKKLELLEELTNKHE